MVVLAIKTETFLYPLKPHRIVSYLAPDEKNDTLRLCPAIQEPEIMVYVEWAWHIIPKSQICQPSWKFSLSKNRSSCCLKPIGSIT